MRMKRGLVAALGLGTVLAGASAMTARADETRDNECFYYKFYVFDAEELSCFDTSANNCAICPN